MKFAATVFLCTLIMISCKEVGDEQDKEHAKAPTEVATTAEKTSEIAETNTVADSALNPAKEAALFIEKVLQENQRSQEFATDHSMLHLDMFAKSGLQQITAFSDKRYTEKRAPMHYDEFILFAFKYDVAQSATKSYEAVRKMFELKEEDYVNLAEEEQQRIRKMKVDAKHGGMICQKGQYLFSLVETCRETPIGGKWEAYEDLFLSFISEPAKEVDVLNANC